jgi:hypothetical protein
VSTSALVIGGSGPTGPLVVQGLRERFDDVTVLHSGAHEYEHGPDVMHLHADPRSAESVVAALGGRAFDVAVSQYGRLALLVDVLAGRTGHLVAIGGATAGVAPGTDPRWGPAGRPAILDESALSVGAHGSGHSRRVVEAERRLFVLAEDGHFAATYLAYPVVYGPRQQLPHDWCVVRRLLDRRPRLFLADGGLKLESRIYAENAAAAVLRIVDRPELAAGRRYLVTDAATLDMRTRLSFLCDYLGFSGEVVDLPYESAWPCWPWWRFERGHRAVSDRRIRSELGHVDAVSPETAMAATVDWLQANPLTPDQEAMLGDPFDYAWEDGGSIAPPPGMVVGKRPLFLGGA